ncbi:MAG TPA: hypothetical protein ENJ79_11475 [Gammaproteobacteria bacterium]|nr:hypothetical protein [Gammaproteobacteria bacterium]
MKNLIPLCLLALSFGSGPANAAVVNFSFDGTVAASNGAPFGLNVGDTIGAVGRFDDAALSGTGQEAISLIDLTLSVGSARFGPGDVQPGMPLALIFSDGVFAGLDYSSNTNLSDAFDSNNLVFSGSDSFWNNFDGSWNVASFQVTAVPVPAAVWLFGSGLLGVAGLVRRRV